MLEFPAGGIDGILSCADILEIGQGVEKFAANQIQVAIVVEIAEVRRRSAVQIDYFIGGFELDGAVIAGGLIRAGVADIIDKAMQGAFGPPAFAVKGIVPSVIG